MGTNAVRLVQADHRRIGELVRRLGRSYRAGESLRVDTGCIVAFQPSVEYDVQMVGGVILHRGMIAEMVTGEGKTLVATLPAFLNALAGHVHVVTVNDYLARRDCEWMRPVYAALGMTAGAIQSQMSSADRQQQYGCDITYGTNNEFGFDYLRDNMVHTLAQRVQRGHHYAIIDEVDSILIDEARTPLIISGPVGEERSDEYRRYSHALHRGEDLP